jgi:hypothetical protein
MVSVIITSRIADVSPSRGFSQTPTLNARPIKRAVKQACRRGVDVTLFLDLGRSMPWRHWQPVLTQNYRLQ